MEKNKKLKLLLLQVRNNSEVRKEELESFIKFGKLKAGQIDVLNVFDTPNFEPCVVNKYDALLVGGASEASVLKPNKYPFIRSSQRLLLHCIQSNIPVFASCYGFQLAVTAMGGTIIRDNDNYEMGSIEISKTQEAKKDPLFKKIPSQFLAVSVHKEKALDLPSQCELLAYTNDCCHAFRVKNKAFWAFQFHPEVDKSILERRLTIYHEQYTNNQAQLKKTLKSIQPTPHANRLLSIFLRVIRNI